MLNEEQKQEDSSEKQSGTWQEEVEQAPQLGEVVLQRSTGEEQPVGAVVLLQLLDQPGREQELQKRKDDQKYRCISGGQIPALGVLQPVPLVHHDITPHYVLQGRRQENDDGVGQEDQ